jgi:hypothetical protein
MNESIIVYQSQFHRDADQYLSEHPEQMLWLVGIIILAYLIVKVIDKVRGNKYSYRRWWKNINRK